MAVENDKTAEASLKRFQSQHIPYKRPDSCRAGIKISSPGSSVIAMPKISTKM